MTKPLIALFVVLALLMPQAVLAQETELDPKAYCLQNFPKDNGIGMDADGYCSCVAKELGGKLNQAKDDDEKGRKKAIANLKPCLDKHAKKPITDLCNTYNTRVKEMAKDSKEKHPSLNCGCFYKKLVGNFTAKWSTESGAALSQEEQEALAQQTIGACLK